ncbi:hypothetical protein A9970_14045 [Sphingobacterium sp. UME9]|nr:hypothetical protein [Sphingobacterium sp. UME9]
MIKKILFHRYARRDPKPIIVLVPPKPGTKTYNRQCKSDLYGLHNQGLYRYQPALFIKLKRI